MSTMAITPAATVIPNTQRISRADFIATIGDVVRGSLLTNRLEQIRPLLDSVVELVRRRGGRLYTKNFWDPDSLKIKSGFGYVGVHIKIRLPIPPVSKNPAGAVDQTNQFMLMELQIHAREIMDGTEACPKEVAHHIYKSDEIAEEKMSPETAAATSKLVFLPAMKKIHDEMKGQRGASDDDTRTLRAIQSITQGLPPSKKLAIEAALLLKGNVRWASGRCTPLNAEAVNEMWGDFQKKIYTCIKLQPIEKDASYTWLNTARSVDELYVHAMQIAPYFNKICREAADSQPGCSVNFGPGNNQMIKGRQSFQDKMNKECQREPEAHSEEEMDPETMRFAASLPAPPAQKVQLLIRAQKEWDVESPANEAIKKAIIWASHARPIVEGQASSLEKASLLDGLGRWEYLSTCYGKALTYYSEALKTRGADHPAMATSLSGIGNCHYAQGNYSEALKAYGAALEIYNASWDDNHPDVALTLNKIGSCYYDSQRKVLPEVSQPVVIHSMSPALPPIAFGAADWRNYFGAVGAEPPLPRNINEILDSKCPFWPTYKIHQTHLLVLVPETVNGQPLNLALLGDLVQHPRRGYASKYAPDFFKIYFKNDYIGSRGDLPASKSHWTLITQTVINGSRGKSYENQRAILAKCGPSVPYAVPTALDVTVAIFMDHVKTGTKRYADNPATHTRCQGYDRCNLIVGGFSDAGLEVFTDYDGPGRENVGLGGSLYLEA